MWFIIAIIVLLIFIGLFLFMKKSNNTIGKNKKINKGFTNHNSLDFNAIKLAPKIKETINSSELINSTTELYKIFKSLDYKKKTSVELGNQHEWNSWEISQLLYLLQLNRNILMPDCEEVLHPSILEFTKEHVINEIKSIILKYNRSITKDESLFLKNQVIWSAKEVSIIFYYLSLIKSA